MLPQEKVQWLIPRITRLSIEKISIQNDINRIQKELEESPLFLELHNTKQFLIIMEKEESELREQGKQIMLENGLKKFEMLDGTVVQLNSTPWALILEEWVQLDKKYYKEKTTFTMDKVQVKKDFMEWLILDPGVTIESDYKFIIKSK